MVIDSGPVRLRKRREPGAKGGVKAAIMELEEDSKSKQK
jgi:hypothetical protein